MSEKMGTCNKADGSGSVVLRNSTTLVMHMKVYDESIQLGEQWGQEPRCPGFTGKGVGSQREASELPPRAACQNSGAKGMNRDESRLSSTHHPRGFLLFIPTKVPCRFIVAWSQGPGLRGQKT